MISRCDLRVRRVPNSSCSIRREYPATSAAKIAASRLSTRCSCGRIVPSLRPSTILERPRLGDKCVGNGGAYVQNSFINLPEMHDGSITVVDLETGKAIRSIDTLEEKGLTPNNIALLLGGPAH
jgi:hypothetical protein